MSAVKDRAKRSKNPTSGAIRFEESVAGKIIAFNRPKVDAFDNMVKRVERADWGNTMFSGSTKSLLLDCGVCVLLGFDWVPQDALK